MKRQKPIHKPPPHHHHHYAVLSSSIDRPYNIPCRNSVVLSRRDRVLLDYFPASTIFCIHSATTRKWSPLQYVYEVTAGSSSMVMHMILAYSASDLRRKRHATDSSSSSSSSPPPPRAPGSSTCNDIVSNSSSSSSDDMEVELYHYTAALRELQNCITTETDVTEVAWARFEENLDAILATIFFMIHFGLQCMASLDHAKTHIAGLASLVATYAKIRNKRRKGKGMMGGGNDSPARPNEHHGFSPLSSLLVLWILYVNQYLPTFLPFILTSS